MQLISDHFRKMAPNPVKNDSKWIHLGYRMAFVMLRVWGFIFRPRTRGACVALWHQDEILVVQTCYRAALSLPGGFVKRKEASKTAARRELEEETGIIIAETDLQHAGHHRLIYEYRLDCVDIWEAFLPHRPPLKVSGGEIVWAGWMTADELQTQTLLPVFEKYLLFKMGGTTP